ncbi:MAG TPA: hypothetical protein VKU82_00480 [Planctomycetaceae bacterium]|nr:hypothetical protein [Planctomycetaceae bacterium]
MIVTVFNGCEAAIWMVLAIVVLRLRSPGRALRRISRATAGFLVLFSISDLIEMHTGA